MEERECKSRLSSSDSPLSNFCRSHLAFICFLGSLIINQNQAALKNIFRQSACINRTKLSDLSAWLVSMISFAMYNPFLHTVPLKGSCCRVTVQNRHFLAKPPYICIYINRHGPECRNNPLYQGKSTLHPTPMGSYTTGVLNAKKKLKY